MLGPESLVEIMARRLAQRTSRRRWLLSTGTASLIALAGTIAGKASSALAGSSAEGPKPGPDTVCVACQSLMWPCYRQSFYEICYRGEWWSCNYIDYCRNTGCTGQWFYVGHTCLNTYQLCSSGTNICLS